MKMPDAFFGGQVPGTRRLSTFPRSPVKGTNGAESGSSVKAGAGPFSSISPAKDERQEKEKGARSEDDEMDTRSLLERMKETVEGMKRRRSMNPNLSLTPWTGARVSLGMGTSPQKRVGDENREVFSLLAPGEESQFSVREEGSVAEEEHKDLLDVDEEMEMEESDKENGHGSESEIPGDEGLEVGAESDEDMEAAAQLELERESIEGNDVLEEHDAMKFPAQLHTEADPVAHHTTPARIATTAALPLKTPRMDGLRQMFAEPKAGEALHTPSFKGVREMFGNGRPKAAGTPVFEGMGEMLKTPAGYRPDEDAGVDEQDVEEILVKKSARARSATASSSKTPAASRRRTPRTAPANDTPFEASNPVTPVEEDCGKTRGRSGSKQAESDHEEENRAEKPRKARLLRGRKAVKEPVEVHHPEFQCPGSLILI